ncbi:hypothetical protein DND132_3162 [Pseudodesulfovibrio mercurii]|uniref:STAS/SEC14 domain-containing protein n=1 Tax=Pseudodesulfovibrio mercurii TaxID=641491 RepID=F0JKB6_9BACT|nr:hypothetical protein [Pseudodesulfovibrio mercurii]EGB16365.1 hypothetical protein DND132_3162 [Pseudodesulfovibrio mercurii]
MSFDLLFEIRDGYVVGVVTGVIDTPEELLRKIRTMVHKGLDSHLTRFLMDERGLELRLDPHDIIQVADLLEEHNIQSMGGRSACLCNPRLMEQYRACETVYHNRSLSYRVFEREEEAVAWLMR